MIRQSIFPIWHIIGIVRPRNGEEGIVAVFARGSEGSPELALHTRSGSWRLNNLDAGKHPAGLSPV